MTRNAIIFVLASLGILVGWEFAMTKFFPTKAVTPISGVAKPAEPVKPGATPPPPGELRTAPVTPVVTSAKPAAVRTVSLQTKSYQAVLSSQGAKLVQLRLRDVTHKDADGKAGVLDLVDSASNNDSALELAGADLNQSWALLTPQPLMENGAPVVRFSLSPQGSELELLKTYRFSPDSPQFNVSVQLHNRSNKTLSLGPLALTWGPNLGGGNSGIGMFPPAGVVQMEAKIEREKGGSEAKVLGYSKPRWVALKNHYFVAGFFPAEGSAWNKAEIRLLGSDAVSTALIADGLSLAPGQSVTLAADAYAGPQEYDALKALGKNFQAVIQFQFYKLFDWLNPLCILLLHVMKWFQQVTGNWGVAIILLTLLVRGILFWPSLKSMVSMRRMQTKMAAMQPRLDTLKKVYKDDASKLNQEMMKLYKEHGVNPLGGCLPMLLQIPVFFALYGTLSAAFELRGATFMWKWTDLTAGDPTYIFPIAMGASMFFQQKLAPQSATMSEEQQQMQKMMLWMMPIMFTGMALFMHWPMGLLLYWTASNIFGIAQQLAVNKAVD